MLDSRALPINEIGVCPELWGFIRKSAMRNHFNAGLIIVLLFSLSLMFTGCGQFWAQPGKTADEGYRQQVRTMKVNQRELSQDLNHALLLNGPSKLNDMSMP
jgi:hypothetical protein